MENFREKRASVRRLNTKGCCFFCLEIEDVTRTDVDNLAKVVKSCSIRQLFRHLQINENSVNESLDFSANLDGQLIEVNLCKTCREINDNVGKICQNLEKLKLELNYMLECIYSRVTDSAMDSDRVQNYSRRMTSDFEALSQLAFVDKLRKELANKCLKMRSGPISIIQVSKLKNAHERASVKQEHPPTENEFDVEVNFDPPFPSSPSSPNCADSEPSPSSLTAEKVNSEVLKQTAKQTLDVRSSSEAQSTFKNTLLKKKQAQSKDRRQLKDVYYSKNEISGMFHCKKCNIGYTSRVGVRWHFETVHLHLKQKCKICEKLVYPSNILTHEKVCRISTERRLAKQNDAKFKFICKICGKRFETNKKLCDHTRFVHKNVNRFQCDLCDKKYTSMSMLKNHQAAIHQSRKFYCKICYKMCKYMHQVKNHERKCIEKSQIKVESVECG